MLKNLTIKNYALIDQLSVDFDKGLHILTGETGAGKSIILGALGLIMGNRADTKSLYNPDVNCIVEALIDISGYGLNKILLAHDIDESDQLLIRRVISKTGKSRAFVNDLPIALKSLQEISVHLIQVHNQFDNLDLGQPAYQLRMLDAMAQNNTQIEKYSRKFADWTKQKSELKSLINKQHAFEKEKDFLRFQFEELDAIDLQTALEEDIESTLRILSNAESIKRALEMSFYGITEGENAIIDQLNELARELEAAGEGVKQIEELANQIHTQVEVLQEISKDLYDQAENMDHDPKRISEMEELMDQVNNLMYKHKVQDIKDLIQIKEDIEQRLTEELELTDRINQLEKSILSGEAELMTLAQNISDKRKKASKSLIQKIEENIRHLGMPFASMAGIFSQTEELGEKGFDEYEMLFTANKGGNPAPISFVASGGELSRLSLSIKSILAGHMSLPTLIFDEIEAGISGEIALKMGKILKELSREHQIINITHSAQIASRGDRHFFVYKSHDASRSVTRIRELESEERITEIAKMLSGDPPSPTAIKNAEELIHLN